VLASGAKNLAVFLFTVAKGTKQYRGITSVRNLLDGGHELVTLELDKRELRDFCLHAKKNDIPCTVIHDKKLYQDIVPVLVRKVDAERVNRVVDRMRLQHLPEDRAAQVSHEVAGHDTGARSGRAPRDQGERVPHDQTSERVSQNPTTGRTSLRSQSRSRFRPSGRASGDSGSIGSISPSDLRPSVKAKILDMQRERRATRTPDARQSVPQQSVSRQTGRQIIPQPAQQPVQRPMPTPAWNSRDDHMMDAMRQLLQALTTITQEVMGNTVRESAPQRKARQADIRQQDIRQSTERSQEKNGAPRSADGTPLRTQESEPRQSVRDRMAQARNARANKPAQAPAIKPRTTGRGGR
jgi:hypothetical protein